MAEIRRLQQLFEQAPGIMVILRGPEHIFESANSSYLQLVGNRQLIGKSVREALPEVVNQGFIDLLDQVFKTGDPFRGHSVSIMLQRYPEGELEERWVDFVYQPIRDDSGSVSGIFVEAFDVTEGVLSANALRESEYRLRQLINTIPQLAWIANANGNLTWYNDRWYDYTGTTFSEMKDWGWQQAHDPAHLPRVIERWKQSLVTGKPFEMTFPLRDKEGNYRPFFTLVAPLKDSSGKIVQWFGTNTDVSSLQKAESALEKTEAWLEAGLMTGRMVVWEWDLTTHEVICSDNSEAVLGYTTGSEPVGWSSIHPEDAERLKTAVNRAIKVRSEFHETTRRIRPDNGQLIWIEIRGKVLCDERGPYCVRGVVIDVTERMNAEQGLVDASRRKDEFLAMLAHELRNPLAPICAAAEILKICSDDKTRVAQASEVISRQAKHMTDLVDDLFDVSRVTRGLVKLQLENVDVKSVVSNAIEQVRPLIEARGHAFTTHIAPITAVVSGDRTRLVQVIANLLNNAAKYTPQGGRISLSMEVQPREVNINITDNGIGIEPTLLPHIFELFTQAERTSDRSQGGLGLGLALAKSVVLLHGGRVDAQSQGRGQGSTFGVFLPLIYVESSSTDSPEDTAKFSESLRLMIVDDNVDAAESLGMLLEMHGHTVTIMEHPKNALDVAAKSPPDVFILDIGLPEMDGYELARRLRANSDTANALFIALTGYGQAHDKILSKAAGFDHHIVKPLNTEELYKFLNKRMQRSASQ